VILQGDVPFETVGQAPELYGSGKGKRGDPAELPDAERGAGEDLLRRDVRLPFGGHEDRALPILYLEVAHVQRLPGQAHLAVQPELHPVSRRNDQGERPCELLGVLARCEIRLQRQRVE